ncbi:hypothetical protein GLOIN_2v1777748 [Rhizophagus irregularis DAOM 181602=DAOM 197198]|nr:hypothetical protein GLOIN_2v1777748 [Rhizophagus irregularis DAOM 181602=DAOM 197198]
MHRNLNTRSQQKESDSRSHSHRSHQRSHSRCSHRRSHSRCSHQRSHSRRSHRRSHSRRSHQRSHSRRSHSRRSHRRSHSRRSHYLSDSNDQFTTLSSKDSSPQNRGRSLTKRTLTNQSSILQNQPSSSITLALNSGGVENQEIQELRNVILNLTQRLNNLTEKNASHEEPLVNRPNRSLSPILIREQKRELPLRSPYSLCHQFTELPRRTGIPMVERTNERTNEQLNKRTNYQQHN